MKVQIVAGLLAIGLLAGCQSRYSPNNWGWFGGSQSEPTLAPNDGYAPDYDRRPLVQQVVSMSVDQVPGGAIVTAVGLPPTQGYWEADLVSTYETESGKPAPKDGVMRLEFRIVPPRGQKRVSTAISREVTAGTFLSDQALGAVRTITVVGSGNQRSSGR